MRCRLSSPCAENCREMKTLLYQWDGESIQVFADQVKGEETGKTEECQPVITCTACALASVITESGRDSILHQMVFRSGLRTH